MRGTWASSFVLLVGFGFGCACSGKKSEQAPDLGPAMSAQDNERAKHVVAPIRAEQPASAPSDGAVTAAVKPAAAAPPDPIASLFRVTYTPRGTLPDKLRRQVRARLSDKTTAPIALHHVIDVVKTEGGRDVFALYEYSAYEDCMADYRDRQLGREACLGEAVSIGDGVDDRGHRLYKQARFNSSCVHLGALRGVFAPPAAGEPADAGQLLALWSMAFTEMPCEVRRYNRVVVADVDGDHKLEMYVDLTAAREEVGEVRDVSVKMYNSRRLLYILSGDEGSDAELALNLGEHKAQMDLDSEELIALRDLDHDGHLDVIETKLCFEMEPMSMGAERPCDWASRPRTAYLYDAEKDAYHEAAIAVDDGSAATPSPQAAPPNTAPP